MDASMSSDWLLVIGGFALLLGGGEVVVQGAVTIAKKMKVPPLLIGFTIVAIGTSLPELAVSLEAVAGGQPDIAVGGVLGSNVANVMLVLGTASILGAASDPGEGVRRDALAMILATLILLALVIFGEITWFFGIMMLALLAGYYSYSYLNSKEDSERKLEESWVPDNIVIAMVVTIIGGALIWKGAEFLVDGATGIASGLGISEAVIGLSVVALGTSLPELAVTLVAGLRGQGGVAVGNILGSNMMNILGILGATAALGGGIMISSNFADRDIWVVLVTSGLVAAMLLDDREIGKITGVSMVVGYLVYMSIIL
ncbi:MAG: sodium:calcium antiporter [Euryarchaeota archaeon]|nr:sodium:calcium antiporter [Euryarchaeota archaeon]|tara:strand:- start:11146 stop:12087 length:942 start_codon:yes stop_codon:yes gene_type:complete